MKIGLEKELWLIGTDGKPFIIPSSIPHDDCGLLVEARSKPCDDVTEAVYSLMADETRIRNQVATQRALPNNPLNGAMLNDSPIQKIDRRTEIEVQRNYVKGAIRWQNIYGIRLPSNRRGTMTAAIHVSFTNPTITERNGTVNKMFDFVTLFRGLDIAFAEEIKTAGRKPGFYEIKDDGRIEYRSLPANVPFETLIKKLTLVLSKPWEQWDRF